jgi:hypothetical protein
MNSIDYLSGGYNIFRGDPFHPSSMADPGMINADLYEFTYYDNHVSSDGRFLQPDNAFVRADTTCNGLFSTKVM